MAHPEVGARGQQYVPCLERKLRAVRDGPQRDMGIEEHVQRLNSPRNRRAICSLSASMSSGTTKASLATPRRGPTGEVDNGTSLAAGLPLRAMMISRSSPCSMASTKRDKLDFA